MIWFLFAAIAILFSYKTNIFLDPDFGWQLKTGEYILVNGFPRTDIFSYTLPDFPVVMHSWLSDVIYAVFYPSIGYLGLSILSAILATTTIFLLIPRPLKKDHLTPILLAFTAIFPYMSVRPQIFTWFGLSILLKLTLNQDVWKKYKHLIPVLFLLWAQLHGGFAIGLGLLIVFALIKRKKEVSLLALMSVFITLINPYGIQLWREVLFTFFSPNIRLGINEWAPFIAQISIFDFPIITISGVFLVWFWKKYTQFEKISFIVLFALALSSSKLFPLWTIAAIPIIVRGLSFLARVTNKNAWGKKYYSLLLNYLIVVVFTTTLLSAPQVISRYRKLSEENYYPQESVQYLKAGLPNDRIFTAFGWGGYMDWKLPEKKVFIDGRMPYWDSILREYHEIRTADADFNLIAKEHSISTVLIPINDDRWSEFENTLINTGWQRIHSDDVAVIYSAK